MPSVKVLTSVLIATTSAGYAMAQDNDLDSIKMLGAANSKVAYFENSDGSESGLQIVTPIELNFRSVDWDFGVKTAHIYSERKSNFVGGSGTVSTISDTAVSGTYRAYAGNAEWLGGRRITFALNGDLNLPTGKERLSGSEKNAVFDSFLVDQDRFGEGFNVGAGFSSTISLTQGTLFGLGASYIYRGDYKPDGDNPTATLEPGNHFVVSTQLLHTTQNFQGNIGYRLIDEAITMVNRAAIYDRALSHEFFASAAYKVDEKWTGNISALYATRGADRSLNPLTGSLAKSVQDDNGDTYFILLGASRLIGERSRIGLNTSYRMRGKNEFDESNFGFKPDLRRFEIGGSFQHVAQNGLNLSAGISYFNVKEGSILGFSGAKFDGVTLSLGVSHAF